MEYQIMNLHNDEPFFAELVTTVAQAINLPEVYIEKDYWVTKALKYLSEFSRFNEVVFKGGTSLSKAYKLINRFSEDIDLAIFSDSEQSQNSGKRLLKQVETAVSQGLIYLKNDARESKGSRFRKTVYQYPRIIKNENFGQASPELLIEINSFSIPEPFIPVELQSLISEVLMENNRLDIVEKYNLHSFNMNVLSVERTLVEKILAMIKDSYSENPVEKISARIRHLYDICQILRLKKHRDFIVSDGFNKMLDICILDEENTFDNQLKYFRHSLINAPLFSEFKNWSKSINSIYNGVFADLAYGELPTMNEIEESIYFIRENL